MKILIVIPYFYPAIEFGGPVSLTYLLTMELNKKNQLSVLTTDAGYKKRTRTKIKTIKIYRFKNLSNFLAWKYKIFTPLGFLIKAPKIIYCSDVIHLHGVFNLLSIYAGLLAIIFKKKYFFTPHGMLESQASKNKALIKKLIYNFFLKAIIKKSNKIVVVSRREKSDLIRLGFQAKQVVHIPNGVAIEKSIQPKTICRKILKLPEDKKIILFLGRINWKKGLNILIKAFSELNNDNTVLLIVGPDDGYLKLVKKLIKYYKLKNRVIIRSAVMGKKKSFFYQASDIFVLPSYSEGFSMSILEAMSFGLPVIISKQCNFDDVAKFKAGIIINTNINSLKKALEELTKNYRQRKFFGNNAKRLIVKNYSIQKNILKHLFYYQNC